MRTTTEQYLQKGTHCISIFSCLQIQIRHRNVEMFAGARAPLFISASQRCHPACALNQHQFFFFFFFWDPTHPHGSTTTDNSPAYANQSNARCLNDYFFTPTTSPLGIKEAFTAWKPDCDFLVGNVRGYTV